MVNVPYFLDGEQRESLLVDAEEALRKRETTVLRREALMQEREEALERMQSLYKQKEAEMKTVAEQAAQRQAELDSREAELAEREEQVAEKERQLEELIAVASNLPNEVEIKAEPVDVSDTNASGTVRKEKRRRRKQGASKRRKVFFPIESTPAIIEASSGLSSQPKPRRNRLTKQAKHGEKPRTAWNFWLGENVTRLMEQRRREENSESTTRGAIFRLGGEEWARVADKSRWEEMARLDRERLRTDAATVSEPPPLR